MKKVWLFVLAAALLPQVAACGSPSSAQGTGGTDGGGATSGTGATNGTGGTTQPPPEYSYDVPCDESYVKITRQYDPVSIPGGYERGELESTTTQTVYYSWTTVENPRDVIIYACDNILEYVPPLPPPEPNSYGAVRTEVVREDPEPERECWVTHGANFSGNRIYTRCTTVSEIAYNKSWSEYDPAEHVDRIYESGTTRITITGTRVTE